jgi:FixJ family two-component response regulator
MRQLISAPIQEAGFDVLPAEKGREAGASGWIVKPFRSQNLMDVIHKFVK